MLSTDNDRWRRPPCVHVARATTFRKKRTRTKNPKKKPKSRAATVFLLPFRRWRIRTNVNIRTGVCRRASERTAHTAARIFTRVNKRAAFIIYRLQPSARSCSAVFRSETRIKIGHFLSCYYGNPPTVFRTVVNLLATLTLVRDVGAVQAWCRIIRTGMCCLCVEFTCELYTFVTRRHHDVFVMRRYRFVYFFDGRHRRVG